ncbi:MAG: TRAP transporter large permease subunit, partial [Deltaproteobacteria bacterium]|nr:TRAP transporter large permease subunit [Deltaproteobacteria bacterium]
MATESKMMETESKGLIATRKFENAGMAFFQRVLLWAIPGLAIPFNFDLPSHFGLVMLREQYLAIVLSLVLCSVFLLVPAGRRASLVKAPWYDLILALLSAVAGGYLVLFYPSIVNEVGELTPDKIAMGAMAILLIMEACRRLIGWILVIIAGIFIFYAHYAHFFPGVLNAKGISWSKIAVHLFIDPNALLGIPLDIAASIVVAFIVFGQAFSISGGGDFFTDVAMSAMGRFRGGAAKISVLSSALFG